MKYNYTLIAVCFFTLFVSESKAQNYIPFPDSNAIWVEGSQIYSGYNGHALAICDGPLFFGADTIIGAQVYHTLWGQEICKWDDMPATPPPPGTITTGTDFFPVQLRIIFRQDSIQKKVFIYSGNQEHLLYDFSNLIVGQSYPATFNNPHPNLNVMAHDSVLFNGIYHERWILGTNSQDSGSVAVIEGIGSTQGFANEFLLPFESMNYLFCFSKNGVEYFSDWSGTVGLIIPSSYGVCSETVSVPDLPEHLRFELFPNPGNGRITIKSEVDFSVVELIDLRGRILQRDNLLSSVSLHEMDITAFPEGIYLLRISGESFQVHRKLIIAR